MSNPNAMYAEFEHLSAQCDLYTGRPWDGTTEHVQQLSARMDEITDILADHADWLEGLKNLAAERGMPWHQGTLWHLAAEQDDRQQTPGLTHGPPPPDADPHPSQQTPTDDKD
ncbi:MAG TPA: hypothetical protein PK331_12400 [Gordonia sp. (in: high G+C Gram-positive bacteria)]|uniref:hypothetical protein n=1 Tax=unclassified Gordonia (in: high G+C Gram-positive bacteria) TaxID=2657482 RepID=UPI000FB5CB87|nr:MULTISPECIES: hypothetical protein [unclassified Gordonia (in: high G+C Gram-positive bacteria)]RTL09684.1 MAG: hypothetical protein EKK62_00800 [Acidimicrobiia bacterium]HNP58454.1 hypothetical protein [Gordonia sp. (in: high G+C Gram-positive bacteria)]HRC51706.1 hypothetical protein [Gordonia sp. (in: high G+C Gram-positive bacteria)]